MLKRGFYVLKCPYCEHAQEHFVDMDAGHTYGRCEDCEEWYNFALRLETTKRGHTMGHKSPTWDAAVRFARWVPEGLTPSVAADLLYGVDREYTEDNDGAPFLSEAYLCNVLGKEDARTLLALMSQLLETTGMTLWEVQKEAHRRSKEDG
ncbi:MAG: hypothetical protein GWN93_06030 [Deltaproteobacteria bacterium]|nr:hypothetical protein [Deltaproteobacteria bacterium]